MPNAATEAEIHAWLERFAACVRAVDYAAARPFWHPDVVIFGTHATVLRGVAAWQAAQWDSVWPRTEGFAFRLETTVLLPSADGATVVVVAPWTSTGFHPDGTRFDRPGRATLMLSRGGPEGWQGVHSHMSLNRGVPQDSHGTRPVRAW